MDQSKRRLFKKYKRKYSLKKCIVVLSNIENFKSSQYALYRTTSHSKHVNKGNDCQVVSRRSNISRKQNIMNKSKNLKNHSFVSNYMKDNANSNKKTCHVCGSTVNSMFELYVHIKKNHLSAKKNAREDCTTSTNSNVVSSFDQQDTLYCPICARPFTRQVALNMHMADHNGKSDQQSELNYRCHVCRKRFDDLSKLRKHKSIQHNVSKAPTSVSIEPDKSFSQTPTSQSALSEKKIINIQSAVELQPVHKDKSILELKYRCHICKKKFDKLSKLRNHKFVEHNVNQISVPISTEPETIESSYFTKNANADVVYIDEIDKTAEAVSNLKYRCNVCKENFDELGKLQNHKLTHQNIIKATTPVCVKSTDPPSNTILNQTDPSESSGSEIMNSVQSDAVQVHPVHTIKSVTNSESLLKLRYRCHICKEKFDELLKLRFHKFVHHKINQTSPPAVVNINDSSSNVALIQLSVDSEKLTKATERVSSIEDANQPSVAGTTETVEHIVVDTVVSRNLETVRIEPSELETIEASTCPGKTYKCRICMATFANGIYLKRHNLTAHGKRPEVHPTGCNIYICPMCNASFYNKYEISRHVTAHHKELPTVNCTNSEQTEQKEANTYSTSIFIQSTQDSLHRTQAFTDIDNADATLVATNSISTNSTDNSEITDPFMSPAVTDSCTTQQNPDSNILYPVCKRQFLDKEDLVCQMACHEEPNSLLQLDETAAKKAEHDICIDITGDDDTVVNKADLVVRTGRVEKSALYIVEINDNNTGDSKNYKVVSDGGNGYIIEAVAEGNAAPAPLKDTNSDEVLLLANDTSKESENVSNVIQNYGEIFDASAGKSAYNPCVSSSKQKQLNANVEKPKIFLKNLNELIEPAGKDKISSKTLNCHYCGRRFVHEKTLLRHMRQARLQKCTLCNYFACNVLILEKHYDIEHPNQLYRCTYCDFVNDSRDKYNNHLIRVHENNDDDAVGRRATFLVVPVDCGICSLAFSNMLALKSHLNSAHNEMI